MPIDRNIYLQHLAKFDPGNVLLQGKIVATVAANALTVAIKTPDGQDPSSSRPVYFSVADGSGSYSIVVISAALSLTAPNGHNFGVIASVPFGLNVALFDNGGSPLLALLSVCTVTTAPTVDVFDGVLATALGLADTSTSDGAGLWFASSAVSDKSFRIIGSLQWSTGLASAGVWAVGPDVISIAQHNTAFPGSVVKAFSRTLNDNAFDTDVVPFDDTIWQGGGTEGFSYFTFDWTPSAAGNWLDVEAILSVSHTVETEVFIGLVQEDSADAIQVAWAHVPLADGLALLHLRHRFKIRHATEKTYDIRIGAKEAGTLTVNGVNTARKFGGRAKSLIVIQEIAG